MCYETFKPEPPPQPPLSSFSSAYHQLAFGGYSPTSGLLLLNFFDCTIFLPSQLAVAAGMASQLDKAGGSGAGSIVLNADTTSPFDCADGTVTSGPLTLTPLAFDHNEDSAESLAVLGHADPCTDRRELGATASTGGLRDPFNPYDFYDPNGDGTITQGEVNAVAGMFGAEAPGPPYLITHDRGPSVGPNKWNTTAPDGTIILADVLAISAQFGHEC